MAINTSAMKKQPRQTTTPATIKKRVLKIVRTTGI
jgi:hypothetical protein